MSAIRYILVYNYVSDISFSFSLKIQLCCCSHLTFVLRKLHTIFFPFRIVSSISICVYYSLSLFFTHFLCVIFPLRSFCLCTLLSYGWSQVCLIRNYHVCVRRTVALCFTFQSNTLVGMLEKGNFFLLLLSVASLSCHFTPLLFKLALFTVVYNAFMRERLFYAMMSCVRVQYTQRHI